MSPPAPAADSGEFCRDTPDEINGFHNDKIVAHSTPPLKPPSFPGGAFVIIPPEILRRVVVSSVKGFSIGAGIKGGLALFAILARFARKKPPRWVKKFWTWWSSDSFFFFVMIDFVFVQEGDCCDEWWSDCYGFEGNVEIWFVSWNLRRNFCFNGWSYCCSWWSS